MTELIIGGTTLAILVILIVFYGRAKKSEGREEVSKKAALNILDNIEKANEASTDSDAVTDKRERLRKRSTGE